MNEWFYGTQGNQQGPVSEEMFRTLVSSGAITPETLVWRQGMADWQPLKMLGHEIMQSNSPYASPHPGYAGQSIAPTSGLAIASLVCGIVGILMCMAYVPGIPGLAAVICGHMAKKRIQQSTVPMAGEGMCMAGLIMGYLAIFFQVLIIVALVFFFGVFMRASSSGSAPSFLSP